jgi:hypothetical protein
MEETVRVRTTRVIYYQGPRRWLEHCLTRIICGTMQMGAGKFVTGAAFTREEEPAIVDLVADVPTFKYTQAGDAPDPKLENLIDILKRLSSVTDHEVGHLAADEALLAFIGDDRVMQAFAAVKKEYA